MCIYIVLASGSAAELCCDELLLTENENGEPDVLDENGETELLEFEMYSSQFDARMATLGFHRSPTQPSTVADGNCGLYAMLDQLNRIEPDHFFDRDDALFAR